MVCNLKITKRIKRDERTDHCIRANTRHLSRILFILKDTKLKYTYTQLRDITGIYTHLSDALRFLVNHKLIICEKAQIGETKLYYVNIDERRCK